MEPAMSPRIAPASTPYEPLAQSMLDRLPKDWGPPFLVFTVLARDPQLLQRYINGSVGYLESSHISIRQREVFLLRVTARCRCVYEWGLRVHFFAEAADLSPEQIHATTMMIYDAAWTDSDRILLRLADELHETSSIGEALWADLSQAFSSEAILQLLMLAGYYRTMAYLANGLNLPAESGLAVPFPADATV